MTEPNQAAPNATPAEPVLFGARNAQTEPRNWTPVIVGFVLMLAVVVAIVVLGRTRKDVVKTADPYAPNLVPLRQQVARYVFPPLAHSYSIVPAELGEEVVVHGALAMARDM